MLTSAAYFETLRKYESAWIFLENFFQLVSYVKNMRISNLILDRPHCLTSKNSKIPKLFPKKIDDPQLILAHVSKSDCINNITILIISNL